jgi:iron only hydrogenase large subunit-like protein
MGQYYHAHKVIEEKCEGHMKCLRSCPTEAIRLKQGKTIISEELCVDCGLCISVCPSQAILPITDSFSDISNFKYKVVVPSPVLYSQFDSSIHPYIIHLALKELGFDEVVDVDTSTAALAKVLMKYIAEYDDRLPLISSHCPSILRLIQVRFPDLVELVVPLDVPRELTAREIRKNFPSRLGLKSEDIYITYIAPCPAKIVSIKQPAEKEKSWFDGGISMKDVYPVLRPHVLALKRNFNKSKIPKDFSFNAGWTTLGGITREVKTENWLAVSGLDHVMKIFDDIENSRLRNIDFLEAHVCMLGCIGGPFSIENPYIARSNSIRQRAKYEQTIKIDTEDVFKKFEEGYFYLEKPVLPRATKYFDSDLETSIKRMKEIERVYQKLRQIDCSCCGAPTCRAFAEDFVKGEVDLTDCIFLVEKEGSEE